MEALQEEDKNRSEKIRARENKSLEIKIKIEKELENPNKSKVYAEYDDKDGKVKGENEKIKDIYLTLGFYLINQ